MKYYSLFLSPNVGGLDSKRIEFFDLEARPPIIGKVGLALGDHPLDEMFSVSGLCFVTNNLKRSLEKDKFCQINYEKTVSVKGDANFDALHSDTPLPDYYWRMHFTGEPGKDDFGLYRRVYLVVSERALLFLRKNNIKYAGADLIDVSLEKYFDSDRKLFMIKKFKI